METIQIDDQTSKSPFKRCSLCGKVWNTKEDFLGDELVRLDGYQWNRKKVNAGLFPEGLLIFMHDPEHCGTTLALFAGCFSTDVAQDSLK